MAVQGKKINELTAIGTVSDETVLPAVYVSGTTVNSTANKISIEQISTKVQDDMSTALAGKQDTLVSGTNIKTINNESLLGSGNLDVDGLPSQTGQSGKFLTTDGTNASWAQVSTPESGADTSLSNLTDAGKIRIVNNVAPSDTYETLTVSSGINGEQYTAPADGYFFLTAKPSVADIINMSSGGSSTTVIAGGGGGYNWSCYGSVFIRKGEKLTLWANAGYLGNVKELRFYYAVGSESEHTPQQ